MKTLYRSFVRFLFFLTCAISLHGNAVGASASSKPSDLVLDVLKKTFGLSHISGLQHLTNKTQTVAYLSNETLQTNINGNYADHVSRLGKEYFVDLFKTIIQKELDFSHNYRVFYHGQDRVFMLFHDIYKGLYELVKKKDLCDFIMLRIPAKDTGKFPTIQKFLSHCINNGTIYNDSFDHLDEIRKRLICLNPSLFGNTHVPGECTLDYFMGSFSIGHVDIMDLIKNVFNSFKIAPLFSKYETELRELNSLLLRSEETKTGALLQIFIPEPLVNKLTYRCEPYGNLYYKDKHPEIHAASADLDEYKQGGHSHPWKLDATQFRLLINETTLNPKSGIKMFRYCNKTKNVERYEQKLKNLLKNIGHSLAQGLSLK